MNVKESVPEYDGYETACTTLTLKALSAGDTVITVAYEDIVAKQSIAAYLPLVR